jgi:hypothetical protein
VVELGICVGVGSGADVDVRESAVVEAVVLAEVVELYGGETILTGSGSSKE